MAQTDRGTITGTITDPAGAVVPGANVTATNKATGASVQSQTTSTGNYTLPSLQTGIYDLTIEAQGFNKYIQAGIEVQVAQTARIDVILKIGSATESVTISADAPLLKTESAEQSQTLSGDRVNELPLTLTSAGIRNPIAFAQLQPGAYAPAGGNFSMQVNGIPSPTSNSSYKTLMDGQDMTSGIDATHLSETQPSVEALQEMTLQASNFAAEFGQVAGGLVNFTSKSGTNQFHGSGYDYWTNRVLNAGQAYTVSPTNPNQHVRPVNTNDNFDGSIGGPIIIPKIYNGRNRSFFFFNQDNFITHNQGSGYNTVPTLAMRNGDFSAVEASAPKSLGTEPDGTPVAQYEIFDPNSNYTYQGQTLRQPFPGNIIPMSRIDPVALKIQALLPQPTNSGLVNNLIINDPLLTHVFVPSVKIDHNFDDKTRMSIYWGEWRNWVPKNTADGYQYPLSASRNYISANHTIRATLDRTILPTVLLHIGLGELRYDHTDSSPPATLNYDAVGQLGLIGSDTTPAGFPRIANIGSAAGGGPTSPSAGWGPVNANDYYNDKPTVTSSLTWVKGNHTFKFGEEWRKDIWEDVNTRGSQGIYNFSAAETGLPYVSSTTLNGGNLGFPYASFLLGQVDSATVSNLQDPQIRKIGLGFYAQDTWKVSRNLTLDYGLRYDYETVWQEIHGRFSSFEPNVVNPSAGGLLGGTAYPATCKCNFSPPYKFGFGPRLGVAYQYNRKTVIRGGFGVVYGRTSDSSYITNSPILGTGFNQLAYASPAFGQAEGLLKNGLSYTQAQINDASLNPGIVPYAGQLNPPPYYLTAQGGRPPRILQWNVSLQREITNDLVAEVAYVGNRGAWLQSDSFIQINANSIQSLAAKGYNIVNNPAVLSLLTSNWNSPQAVAAGIKPPYPGYPVTTVAQLLRPFPQFTSISTKWSANGDSWYDGLQAKLTQRLWHGLFGQAAFAYQGAWDTGIETANDITNRGVNHDIQATSQPLVLSYGITYKTPAPGFTTSKLVRGVLKDWTLSGFARDSSGMPIQSPAIQNNLQSVLFQPGGFMNRVPGVDPFTVDLNCHCIDPTRQFVLNPAAWTNPAPGTFGNAAAYYNDYRQQRRPQEQFGVGRIFQLRERVTMQFRAEFYNVFNRTEMGTPTSTNSLATQTVGSNGLTSGGFGWINYTSLAVQPRNGQLLLRFNF